MEKLRRMLGDMEMPCVVRLLRLIPTQSTRSLSLALCGALGLEATEAQYNACAEEECEKMEAALRAIAMDEEPNPAKVNWSCR